ncbi:MAG: DUF4157 domain-containing protein [Methanothrix sp.]|nr:DUF4157 domain-containing protein [Methanothrix sp.]
MKETAANVNAGKNESASLQKYTASVTQAKLQPEAEIGLLNGLMLKRMCRGCRSSPGDLNEKLAAMPFPARRTTAMSLQKSLGNRFMQGLAVQAKLAINRSDDPYEREADRIAEHVMNMPEPAASGHVNRVQQACPEREEDLQRQSEEEEEKVQAKPLFDLSLIQRQEEMLKEDEEEETLQAKTIDRKISPLIQRQAESEDAEEELVLAEQLSGSIQNQDETGVVDEESILKRQTSKHKPKARPYLEGWIRSMSSGGQPLSQSERDFFEPRFGYDFGRVRIHNNTQSSALASKLNAKAFTIGNEVVFGLSQYTTDTTSGRTLLAHELTHVLQQNSPIDRHLENSNIAKNQKVRCEESEAMDTFIESRVTGPSMGSRTLINLNAFPLIQKKRKASRRPLSRAKQSKVISQIEFEQFLKRRNKDFSYIIQYRYGGVFKGYASSEEGKLYFDPTLTGSEKGTSIEGIKFKKIECIGRVIPLCFLTEVSEYKLFIRVGPSNSEEEIALTIAHEIKHNRISQAERRHVMDIAKNNLQTLSDKTTGAWKRAIPLQTMALELSKRMKNEFGADVSSQEFWIKKALQAESTLGKAREPTLRQNIDAQVTSANNEIFADTDAFVKVFSSAISSKDSGAKDKMLRVAAERLGSFVKKSLLYGKYEMASRNAKTIVIKKIVEAIDNQKAFEKFKQNVMPKLKELQIKSGENTTFMVDLCTQPNVAKLCNPVKPKARSK